MWQVCPKCKGSKTLPQYVPIHGNEKWSNQCDVCDGTGIINEITGLPPQKSVSSETQINAQP